MQAKLAAHQPFNRQIRDRLGDKWTVPVVDALSDGPLRFSELWRTLGTAPKVLTNALRSLERDGLVERHESRDAGLQVEYRLSATGRAFRKLVEDIDVWSARHEPRIIAARDLYAPPTNRCAPASTSAPLPGTSMALSHICIPVRDIDQAIRGFADVLGVEPSRVQEAATVLQAGHGRERIRLCLFQLRNLVVELIQQMSGDGPYNDFLNTMGPGVAHIGLDVDPDWRVNPQHRQSFGPRLVERPDGSLYRADIDLSGELGTEIHLLSPPLWQTLGGRRPSSSQTASLATVPVSHIGIVVPNVMQADRMYSKLMRVVGSGSARRPRAFRYRQTQDAMTATCSHGEIAINLIQPLRAGPLRDHLRRHGPGVHHVGFNVGTHVATTVERLERQGAEPLFGDAKSGHVRLDLSRTLGLRIDVTSARKAASPRRS